MNSQSTNEFDRLTTRVKAVRSFEDLIGRGTEAHCDEIVKLAALTCHTPLAFISIVDGDSVWFKGTYGVSIDAVAPHESFCSTAIELGDKCVVEDVRLDPIFCDLPCAATDLEILFYAGVVFRDPNGTAIGVLCVADREPRKLSPDALDGLEHLARMVESHIELRMSQETALRKSRELEERQALLEILSENIPEVFWIFDLDKGQMVYINAVSEQVYGVSRDECYNDPEVWFRLLRHEDDRARLIKQFVENQGIVDMRYRMTLPEGEVRWMHSKSFAVGDASPNLVAGITTDVTAEVRKATALEYAEKTAESYKSRHEHIFQHSRDALILVDLEGRITDANQVACEFLGNRQEVVGTHVGRFIVEDERERLESLFYEAIRERGVQTETVLELTDGRVCPVEVVTSAIEHEDETLFHISIRDISEKKASEDRLRETREQLAQSQKLEALGQLSAGIAHDFNNVLSVVQTYTEFALESVGQAHPAHADMLEVLGAAKRSADLTRKLLVFGRRQQATVETFELDAMIAKTCSMLERTLGSVRLETHLAASDTCVTLAPSDLEQVIMNLVLNARDAIGDVGGNVSVSTTVRNHDVFIVIRDDGPGMTAEVKRRIFEPFFTTKEPGRGTGLGLSVVHSIVDQAGGVIEVDSVEDAGTSFRIRFPLSTDDPSIELHRVGFSEVSECSEGIHSVLVVDDEAALRSAMIRTLQGVDLEVRSACNGDEAVEVLDTWIPDLIITDVRMPVMSGLDLAAIARFTGFEGPILFVSAYLSDEDAGSNFVLRKPFSPSQLLAKIEEIEDLHVRPPDSQAN